MSGEKIQRWDVGILRSSGDCDGGCHLSPGESENGEWMNSTDVLAALASRDATIKTQGEEIERLRVAMDAVSRIIADAGMGKAGAEIKKLLDACINPLEENAT